MGNFEKLKTRSGAGELERLRGLIRFGIGKHKQKKLGAVLGTRGRSTLLSDSVSATHSRRLHKQFMARWRKLTKEEQLERLRFWTVLGSLAELNVDSILQQVDVLNWQLRDALKSVKGVEVIGAFEIEIVNFSVMKRIADQSQDDEARKRNVLRSLSAEIPNSLLEPRQKSDSYALVHFHGVVDLGNSSDEKMEKLRKASSRSWTGKYQVELTGFHSDKTVQKNLENIAKYLVKGGNENLIYKIGFGWDSVESMERQMAKQGKKLLDSDFEGFENELSLTAGEIKVLGTALDKLMGSTSSKNMRNGYLFRHGQQLGRR